MLTFLLGPLLALLPRRWRNSLSFAESVNWRIAAVLSAFAESAIALTSLLLWYSYYMNLLVSNGLDSALAGKMGGATDQAIGFTALVIWATHPLTWLISYAGVEGSVRLVGAALTENNLGILPLFLLDRIFLKITGRSGPSAAKAAGYADSNLSSYVGAIRDKTLAKQKTGVPDELFLSGVAPEEILEIRACRKKADWSPPRTVHYQGNFYRLEASSEGAAPRPYRYSLRKLSAGVMGRTVLVYAPEQQPVLAKR